MKKCFFKGLFLLPVLIFLSHAAGAAELPLIEVSEGTEKVSLSSGYSFFLDRTGSMSPDRIMEAEIQNQFSPPAGKNINFGVVPDYACWVKLRFLNSTDKPRNMVLELGTSTINTAEFYLVRGSRIHLLKKDGDLHPVSRRDYFHRHINFSFRLDPGNESVFYLRLQTEAILETSLELYSKEAFVAKLPLEFILLGLFYSAFIVAILYNLFIYFSLRDRNYLLYVLYAASFFTIWVFIDGLGQMFLWPENPWQQVWGARISNTVTCLFMVLFASSFFNCRKNAPRIFKIFMAIAALCIFNTVMVTILPLEQYKAPVRLAWVLAIPVIIFTAALFFRRGFRRARYFLGAWILVLFGASVFFTEMYLGLIPNSFFTRYSWRIASVLEIIMLSLALADRINELNEEKEAASARALEAETLLKQGLEERVRERTEQLQKALDDVSQLSGLLPICSSCKKIRDDKGYWTQIESYIASHSEAEFSHSLCPDCMEKNYGSEEWFKNLKKKNKL